MSRASGGPLDVRFESIPAAALRIADLAVRTPIVRFPTDDGREVWLKLETLQPIGSMKLRGVLNAIRVAPLDQLVGGVVTTSSGNFGRAVAWVARALDIPATVAVPEHAPPSKKTAISRLGATVIELSYQDWWDAMLASRVAGVDGHFIHPVLDAEVIAGAGTVGLEIADQVPDLDTLVVPFGGGSLAIGSALALAHAAPAARVVAVEPETGAPLAASFRAGHDIAVEYTPSFVDAAGAPSLLPGVWERVSSLVADAVSVSTSDTKHAVRAIVRETRVTAEGAGALSLAALLAGRVEGQTVVCVVSGGNIEPRLLSEILVSK